MQKQADNYACELTGLKALLTETTQQQVEAEQRGGQVQAELQVQQAAYSSAP